MPHLPGLDDVAARQRSAVTLQQCLALGATRSWVDRRVRAGDWQRLHPGVLVAHSGPVPWATRAWAALLHAGADAALSHAAAGFVHGIVERPPAQVTVTIPHARRVRSSPGVRVVRRRELPPMVLSRRPDGLLVVEAAATVVDLAAECRDEDDLLALLARAVRHGVPPDAILAAMSLRRRSRGAAATRALLGEVRAGAESALEHRYVRDVERPHGLPRGRAQAQALVGGRRTRADRLYDGVRVELDGALHHHGQRADADVWRDNAALLERGEITLRYRWRHVALDPCGTAMQVAAALGGRGWTGHLRRCAPGCGVPRAR